MTHTFPTRRASDLVAFAVARLARHIDVGLEMHLDLDQPVAGAGLAPPALDVEAEPPGLVPARLAFGQPREPVADDREGACVSGGIADRKSTRLNSSH